MPVFTANIPAPLKVGDRIEIAGKIKDNAKKMSVNLCAEEGEEPRDVVLHYDVRFHRDNIISLSRKNGTWIASGNYDTNYNMFVPGTLFRIVFEIKDTDVITIYCQGKFHSNFLPKIPLSMARFVVAWADIERVTHCFFYMQGQLAGDHGGVASMPPSAAGLSIHASSPPVLNADVKRGLARQRKKIFMAECPRPHHSSSDTSLDHERTSAQPKMKNKEDIVTSRADKFIYESLMSNPNSKYNKMSPPKNQMRVNKDVPPNVYASTSRHKRMEDYPYELDEADNAQDSTDESDNTLVHYGDDMSQISKATESGMESSNASRSMSPNKGSMSRRARMPFAYFCNIMTKTKKNKRHIL